MGYPLIVAALSIAFATFVLQQYVQQRKPYQLVWAIALAMSAAAADVYVLALPPTGSATAFRVYYWLGALSMPAWLGLGSLYLMAPRKLADYALGALINLSLLGGAALRLAQVRPDALQQLNGGPGTGVLEPGLWLPLAIVLNTLGVIAVVGVAVYSAIRLAQRRAPARLLGANAMIAGGDLIIGVAGSMARVGFPGMFWVVMTVGWVVIFGGFLLTLSGPSTPGRLITDPSLQKKLSA